MDNKKTTTRLARPEALEPTTLVKNMKANRATSTGCVKETHGLALSSGE